MFWHSCLNKRKKKELEFQYLKFRTDKQDFKNKSVTKLLNRWWVNNRKRRQCMDRQSRVSCRYQKTKSRKCGRTKFKAVTNVDILRQIPIILLLQTNITRHSSKLWTFNKRFQLFSTKNLFRKKTVSWKTQRLVSRKILRCGVTV